jgi:hypothetical protein
MLKTALRLFHAPLQAKMPEEAHGICVNEFRMFFA